MPRFVTFQTFDEKTQKSAGTRLINVDFVIELTGDDHVTDVKLSNGDKFTVLKGVDRLKREIENQLQDD